MSDNFETIGTIARNATEEVLIKTGTYWNIEVLDIRWYRSDKPTGKGIRMNMAEAKQLLEILRRKLDEN